MRLFYLIALLSLFCQKVFAQNLGIYASAGISKGKIDNYEWPGGGTIDKKSIFGYSAGPIIEFKLFDRIGLESGILYSAKGYRFDNSFSYFGIPIESKAEVHISFVELPVLVEYRFLISKPFIKVGLGPTFAYGLFGKAEATSSTNNSELETEIFDVEFGSKETEYKRFDLGLMIKTAVLFKSTQIGIVYNLGLLNQLNTSETYKNRYFGITISQWIIQKDNL